MGPRFFLCFDAAPLLPNFRPPLPSKQTESARKNCLHWQATIEDPNVFEKPWMVHRTLPLRTDLERVDEFICENNRDYSGLFQK
jgi:hypothetical protein